MRKLYLDDVRTPADPSWIVVRSYNEFVDWITKNGMPDFISFDHDLADEHYTPKEYWHDYDVSKAYQESRTYTEKTGKDCANWLVENNLIPIEFTVHSANPIGADNILYLLNNWQKHNGLEPNGYKTFWELKIDEDEIQ